jgi:hypothetical protein
MKPTSTIEPLESRIAPAAVFTFTDVDGDTVTVKTSKGTNVDLVAAIHLTDVGGGHKRLEFIDFAFNPIVFSKTNVSITAATGGGGDGFVNVGRINALRPGGQMWISLGNVMVDGNLGEIDAGSGFGAAIPSLTSLTVKSLGPAGFVLPSTGGDGNSVFPGSVKSMRIGGDLTGSIYAQNLLSFTVVGDVQGGSVTASRAGSIAIKGVLHGGGADNSGNISVLNVNSISIGSIVGGGGQSSGSLAAGAVNGTIKSISIGSIAGSDGVGSGEVSINSKVKRVAIDSITGGIGDGSASVSLFAPAGQVTVLHDINGGKGEGSGTLRAYQFDMDLNLLPVNISKLTIGGTLASFGIANQGVESGTLYVSGSVGKLSIANVVGDNLTMDPISFGSFQTTQVEVRKEIGTLMVSGHLGALSSSVGGKIQAGRFSFGGRDPIGHATIGEFGAGSGLSAPRITSLVVNEDISGTAADPVGIYVSTALRSLTVKGNVSFATIIAGLGLTGQSNFGFADAQIGPVKVQGNWTASSLAAGVRDVNGNGFGNADDTVAGIDDSPFVVSTIKSIVIGGTVTATAAVGDYFGFTAQLIGSLKVSGVASTLKSGPFNDSIGVAPDTTVREIGLF